MKSVRTVSRRSFLGAVGGISGLVLGGCVSAPIQEDPQGSPRRDPVGGGPGRESCTDGDSGRSVDPPGAGRHCRSSGGRHRRGR